MKYLRMFFLCFLPFLFFSCPEDDSPITEFDPQPVTYKLLSFVFIQQTATNEESLSYEVEFFNSNDFDVKGNPQITLTIGGGATSTSVPNSDCQVISANSSCILTYSVVDDNPNLFPSEPIEFVSADYILE
ncbi:hypothetical protein [Thalassobellus citreus]|uniref:hypothetical protein n=1 Tax=Thalassobellus citreus TaxID=3367752 RepID=UPI0037A515C0